MRFYSYVVMYLEGIHAGIQTAHVQGAIASKYRALAQEEDSLDLVNSKNHRKLSTYHEWESKHLVTQVYNGGYMSSLEQRYDDLSLYADKFTLPIAKFHESREALGGVLTSVGIIVPERFYSTAARNADPESNEGAFYRLLHNCKHAR